MALTILVDAEAPSIAAHRNLDSDTTLKLSYYARELQGCITMVLLRHDTSSSCLISPREFSEMCYVHVMSGFE